MLVHQLLLRGMLVGLVAAFFAFGFARVFGEPSVDRAITFESAMHEKEMAEAAKAGHPMKDDDPDIFSRTTQAGIGLFTAVAALAFGGQLIVRTLLFGNPVAGYPSLMAVILFMGGVQLMTLGVIGEYLGRVFNEVKQRPLYLVERHLPSGRSLPGRGNG